MSLEPIVDRGQEALKVLEVNTRSFFAVVYLVGNESYMFYHSKSRRQLKLFTGYFTKDGFELTMIRFKIFKTEDEEGIALVKLRKIKTKSDIEDFIIKHMR